MKNPPAEFDIRYSTLEDLAALQEWFADPREREPFPFETDSETEDSLKNWIGFSKVQSSLTGELGNTICAIGTLFLMPYRKVAHQCSFYIIVAPVARRRGIGSSMVKNLLHLAKTRFRLESVHVEMIEPSHLEPILKRQGFTVFAKQDDFMKVNHRSRSRILMEHFFT